MGSVSCKEKSTNAHLLRQALMHLVRPDIVDLELIGGRCTRQYLLELGRNPFDILFFRQIRNITVRDTPQSIVGYLRCHVPIVLVYDKIRIFPAELRIKWVEDLDEGQPSNYQYAAKSV